MVKARFTKSTAFGPRATISPMCEMSKIPAADRSVNLNGKTQAPCLSQQIPKDVILEIAILGGRGNATGAIFCIDGRGARFFGIVEVQ